MGPSGSTTAPHCSEKGSTTEAPAAGACSAGAEGGVTVAADAVCTPAIVARARNGTIAALIVNRRLMAVLPQALGVPEIPERAGQDDGRHQLSTSSRIKPVV